MSIAGTKLFELSEFHYGKRWLLVEGSPETLFTENETNMERLFNSEKPNSIRERRFSPLRGQWRTRRGESRTGRDQSRRAFRLGNRSGTKLDDPAAADRSEISRPTTPAR